MLSGQVAKQSLGVVDVAAVVVVVVYDCCWPTYVPTLLFSPRWLASVSFPPVRRQFIGPPMVPTSGTFPTKHWYKSIETPSSNPPPNHPLLSSTVSYFKFLQSKNKSSYTSSENCNWLFNFVKVLDFLPQKKKTQLILTEFSVFSNGVVIDYSIQLIK